MSDQKQQREALCEADGLICVDVLQTLEGSVEGVSVDVNLKIHHTDVKVQLVDGEKRVVIAEIILEFRYGLWTGEFKFASPISVDDAKKCFVEYRLNTGEAIHEGSVDLFLFQFRTEPV